MAEEIKTEEKNFVIDIVGEHGKKFYFSGPEDSTDSDREKVVYTLLSHYAYARLQKMFIKQAQAQAKLEESKAEADAKVDAEVAK